MKKEKLKINNEKITSQNAITLIALIITIIILLILVAVTINLTIGENGIFKTAKEAALNYVNAAENERTEIENFFNEAQNIINGGTENNNPPTTPIVTVNDLKVGDYIKYDAGEKGVIMCRVLYPTSSEYGLQIISNYSFAGTTIGGQNNWEELKADYNNAIENLNNMAEAYINTEYVYDARCVGSIPTVINGIFVDKNNHNGESGTVFLPENFKDSTDFGRDTGCYKSDTNYILDEEQLVNYNLLKPGGYWLASRLSEVYMQKFIVGSGAIEEREELGFFVRQVDYNGLLQNKMIMLVSVLGNKGFTTNGFNAFLRPCFSLKSDIIKIISGDGTSANTAYVIGR